MTKERLGELNEVLKTDLWLDETTGEICAKQEDWRLLTALLTVRGHNPDVDHALDEVCNHTLVMDERQRILNPKTRSN